LKILIASSEVYPYSKTGGLADMVSALGKSLAQAGHQVGIITPLYLGIREKIPDLKRVELPLDFPLGVRRVHGEVWVRHQSPCLSVYFIDQPEFFQRSTLYQKYGQDYPDNAERFTFFSKAIAHLALNLRPAADIIHLNDWQTGLAALFLESRRGLPGGPAVPPTCFTIHNLAYQGVFPAAQYALTNLRWELFTPDTAEFYGKLNCLKAGIALARVITTVSPRYAREITGEELGCGLDGLLRQRRDLLHGIPNGVDYEEWNPVSNHWIPHAYSASDLSGKAANKLELQREFGLRVNGAVPLFGNIGRLVEQKGVDILLGALEEMLGGNLQFVLLGAGTPFFENAYQDLMKRYPGKVSVRIGFNEGLSHRIEAGCDFFLMPSRFEPCGLNQMYSLRYGTIPVVRATGGLDDTVIDIRDYADPNEGASKATGIKFQEHSSAALAKALRKALALYDEPELLAQFRQNAMAADFSWTHTAEQYMRVYEKALATCVARA
jgi:starch synthase